MSDSDSWYRRSAYESRHGRHDDDPRYAPASPPTYGHNLNSNTAVNGYHHQAEQVNGYYHQSEQRVQHSGGNLQEQGGAPSTSRQTTAPRPVLVHPNPFYNNLSPGISAAIQVTPPPNQYTNPTPCNTAERPTPGTNSARVPTSGPRVNTAYRAQATFQELSHTFGGSNNRHQTQPALVNNTYIPPHARALRNVQNARAVAMSSNGMSADGADSQAADANRQAEQMIIANLRRENATLRDENTALRNEAVALRNEARLAARVTALELQNQQAFNPTSMAVNPFQAQPAQLQQQYIQVSPTPAHNTTAYQATPRNAAPATTTPGGSYMQTLFESPAASTQLVQRSASGTSSLDPQIGSSAGSRRATMIPASPTQIGDVLPKAMPLSQCFNELAVKIETFAGKYLATIPLQYVEDLGHLNLNNEIYQACRRHMDHPQQPKMFLKTEVDRKLLYTGVLMRFIHDEILQQCIVDGFTHASSARLREVFDVEIAAPRDRTGLARDFVKRDALAKERSELANQVAYSTNRGYHAYLKVRSVDYANQCIDLMAPVIRPMELETARDELSRILWEALRFASRLRTERNFFQFEFWNSAVAWSHEQMIHRNPDLQGRVLNEKPSPWVVMHTVVPQFKEKSFAGGAVTGDILSKIEVVVGPRQGNIRS